MVLALLANAVEMSITSVASAGLGDVTLNAAVGDNNTFAEAGYLDGPAVSYFIEESNGDYESGVGHLTTTQTILVRDQALEKSVGGTVTQLPATKLTATSGGTVSMRPNALMNYSAWNIDPGGAPTSVYDVPDNVAALSESFIPTADRLQLTQAHLLYPREIKSLGIDVNTLDASATNARACIYSANPDGSPGDLLVDTGNINVSTTGIKLVAAASWVTGPDPLLLPAGMYYFGVVTDSTVVRIWGISSSSLNWGGLLSQFDNQRRQQAFPYENSVTGAPPATFTRSNFENKGMVPIWRGY